MADTIFTLAGAIRHNVPEAELGLVCSWLTDAYRELLGFVPDGWSFTYGQSQMICHQSIQGTAYLVQGSTLVQNVVATNGMAAITINNAGLGYAPGDLIYPIGFSGGWLTVGTTGAGGKVLTASITNAGANFTLTTGTTTSTSGSGSGFTCNVTMLGNGVLPGDRTIIVGRQAVFGGIWPCYDIVDNPTSGTFTLSQGYGGVTGNVEFEITNVYWTPTDSNLKILKCLTDPPNQCQLPTSFTFEELNNIDAQRSQSGTPYLLADVDINVAYLAALPTGVTDSFGQTSASQPVLRKEFYPRNQSNYVYPYFYQKWIPDLTVANPNPIAYFSRRGDVIKKRAMADMAMWEGPQILGRRANPVAHNIYMAEFRQAAQDLQIEDASMMQRVYGTWLSLTKLPYPQALSGSTWAMTHPAADSAVGVPFAGDWD